jgi:peptide methionine sulfoxide reductase MsrB
VKNLIYTCVLLLDHCFSYKSHYAKTGYELFSTPDNFCKIHEADDTSLNTDRSKLLADWLLIKKLESPRVMDFVSTRMKRQL